MTDYATFAPSPNSIGRRSRLVVPSDDDDLPEAAKYLYVGSSGTLSIIPAGNADNDVMNFEGNLFSGALIAVQTRRVRETGTTATIYGVFD